MDFEPDTSDSCKDTDHKIFYDRILIFVSDSFFFWSVAIGILCCNFILTILVIILWSRFQYRVEMKEWSSALSFLTILNSFCVIVIFYLIRFTSLPQNFRNKIILFGLYHATGNTIFLPIILRFQPNSNFLFKPPIPLFPFGFSSFSFEFLELFSIVFDFRESQGPSTDTFAEKNQKQMCEAFQEPKSAHWGSGLFLFVAFGGLVSLLLPHWYQDQEWDWLLGSFWEVAVSSHFLDFSVDDFNICS